MASAVISRMKPGRFANSARGLSYVGPFYGVPSIAFYSTESELVPVHIDVGWRVRHSMGASLTVLHTGIAGLLGGLLGTRVQGRSSSTV